MSRAGKRNVHKGIRPGELPLKEWKPTGEQCELCGCYVGTGYTFLALCKFRGHRVCLSCKNRWQRQEHITGRLADINQVKLGYTGAELLGYYRNK